MTVLTVAVDPAIRVTVRTALALLFCWSAAHKLRDMSEFRDAFAAYQIVPLQWLRAAAAMVVGAEVLTGIGLFILPLARAAAIAAAMLLVVYAAAIALNLARGRRQIACGCTGARQPISAPLVARNAVLAISAVLGIPSGAPRNLTWMDAVTIAAGVVTLGLLYAAVEGLIRHEAPLAILRSRGHARALDPASPEIDAIPHGARAGVG